MRLLRNSESMHPESWAHWHFPAVHIQSTAAAVVVQWVVALFAPVRRWAHGKRPGETRAEWRGEETPLPGQNGSSVVDSPMARSAKLNGSTCKWSGLVMVFSREGKCRKWTDMNRNEKTWKVMKRNEKNWKDMKGMKTTNKKWKEMNNNERKTKTHTHMYIFISWVSRQGDNLHFVFHWEHVSWDNFVPSIFFYSSFVLFFLAKHAKKTSNWDTFF